MNPVSRNLARKILNENASQKGKPAERLAHILKRLRQASGFDIRQPVMLRKDEDGLFALLPEERGGDELALCVCWRLGDEEDYAVFLGRSVAFSEKASGEDAQKILDFIHDKGYTDLWVADKLTKVMHNKRMTS